MDSREIEPELLTRVRAVAGALPEAVEQEAWRGVRWRIRARTFAHVLVVEEGSPASYARAIGGDGTVVTFHATGAELAALCGQGLPYVKPVWSPTIAGLVLGPATDWGELGELLTESYLFCAPKKLGQLVVRKTMDPGA